LKSKQSRRRFPGDTTPWEPVGSLVAAWLAARCWNPLAATLRPARAFSVF
jgi:hypothetical protein